MVLEEYNCFDAEMYADELQLEEKVEFRDDQRSEYLTTVHLQTRSFTDVFD